MTRVNHKLGNILRHACLQCIYTWLKQSKKWEVPTVNGSIVVVGVLICCELFHSVCDLKAVQIKMQCSLIQEAMHCEFNLDHNVTKATKNIYCVEDEGAVDHSTVTRWFKKFCSGCKNINCTKDEGAVDCSTVTRWFKKFCSGCKNINWTKDEGAVDCSTVTRWFKKFCSSCKNINCTKDEGAVDCSTVTRWFKKNIYDQARSGRHKTVNSHYQNTAKPSDSPKH